MLNDIFLRPFSVYNDVTDDSHKLRCLALCHGHNHSHMLLSSIKENCFWYMVDNNINSYPDYVCDVSNKEDMSIFPNDYFDYVMTLHFPVGIKENKYKYDNILNNIRRIIKPEGKIYLTELPRTFFHLLDSDDYLGLYDIIDEIIDEHEFNDLALVFSKKFPKQKVTQKKIYDELIHGGNIKHNILNNIMNEKAMQFTLDYLKLFGLYLIESRTRYIIVGRLN